MDDLDRLTNRKEQEKPGFAMAVEKRKGELLLAARLREAREKLKLTQREVAEKWSLSQQSISKIENAKDDHISLHTINEYARILVMNIWLQPNAWSLKPLILTPKWVV